MPVSCEATGKQRLTIRASTGLESACLSVGVAMWKGEGNEVNLMRRCKFLQLHEVTDSGARVLLFKVWK